MKAHPLLHPEDSSLLASFAEHFQLHPHRNSVESLTEIARSFASIPYENLSKIIRFAEAGSASAARELPHEVIAGHRKWGTGGTCFSLTAALLHLVRSLGFEAQPILADRHYGPDTHCALLVQIDGRPHLLDPGYLLVEPILLSGHSQTIETAFNSISLAPEGERLTLSTREAAGWKKRLTFKTNPVDAGEFLAAWDNSFAWDMMHYPVLSRVVADRQLYQRGSFEQVRRGVEMERREIPPDEVVDRIASQFGISPQVIHQALKLLGQEQRSVRSRPS